jgi:hypothetical protein
MAKTFKKNQAIVATLPTGRVVEGVYIEPYGVDGHSFYVNEYEGTGTNGLPRYTQKRYGVKEEFIEASTSSPTSEPSEAQYKAWLKRAMELEARIDADKKEIENLKKTGVEEDSKMIEKLNRKIERNSEKLSEINQKIEEFEGDDENEED